jgi:hypothetical protein
VEEGLEKSLPEKLVNEVIIIMGLAGGIILM